MAVAELSSAAYTESSLRTPQLSYKSLAHPSFHKQLIFRPFTRRPVPRISSCVTSKLVEAPIAVKYEEPKKKPECFGVFCLTYDLMAEDETKSWKKLINIAVSGAAGMISNHLLFKLASGEVFGPDQPIALKLLGSERSLQALEGGENIAGSSRGME